MNKSGSSIRRMPWRRSVAAAVALAISAAAFADTGGLRITINGADGAPLPGATVKVSSPSSLISKTAVTEADGTVRLQGLDPATNYTVEVSAPGLDSLTADNVAVVSGKSLTLTYNLGIQELDEAIVTGRSLAAIDTTSATVGTTITLDLAESLPTGRSYQSYLQMVPGVKPSALGNPSSKSGVNYRDAFGETGRSTDNVYLIDGVNVTDPLSGTFGSNLNSEIIQEMQVLTGGIPAEYAGGQGLVSKVVTKSGSNEFHGSINYFTQSDKLVANNKHLPNSDFKTYDTAVTLGGPIIKDKLWFFGSYQIINRKDEIVDPNTNEFMRKVETESKYAFGKLTWQITDADRLTATFFNDPYERDGSTDYTILNNRSLVRDQGGDNWKFDFSHDFGNLRFDAYWYKHEAELTDSPADGSVRNNVAYHEPFPGGVAPTNAELQLGGDGRLIETWRNRKEFGGSLAYLLGTSWGEHEFKVGGLYADSSYMENTEYPNPLYASMAASNAGMTFEEFAASTGWTGARSIGSSDYARVATAINGVTGLAAASGLDTNGDGTISSTEARSLVFSSTAGNPYDQVNVYRILQREGTVTPYTVKTKNLSLYAQDSWTLDKWSVNAGVRAERVKFVNSAGATIFKFDWTFAPRISVVYDIQGDGRSKVWTYYGRYYDPIRADMADFAGAVTGPTYDEQVYVNDQWVTFRSRGPGDAAIAPTTKTPYTDEFMVGYAKTFGRDLSFSATYTKRVTKDIMEDYDLALYSSDSWYGDPSFAGTQYYLPLSYFGYTEDPGTNYVIGTLYGGKREYNGIELSLQKLRSNHWQGIASYTYNDAKGNSNSDGNADFQGDTPELDPRAPGIWGKQPGNIEHQFKLGGSYYTNFGLEAGLMFNWNSGVRYSKTYLTSSRHLPVLVDEAYDSGGFVYTWTQDDAVGTQTAPSYYTLDARLKYTFDAGFGKAELFLDVFNILNKQSVLTEQDLLDGDGVYDFGEANSWVSPRRAYLGVRFSF